MNVGYKWQSKQGVREIVAYQEFGNIGMRYAVSLNGRTTMHALIKPEEIEREIEYDRRGLIGHEQRKVKRGAIAVSKAAEQAAHDDIQGFDIGMSPLQRSRVIKTLNTEQNYNGKLRMRKHFIEQAIKAGSRTGYREHEGCTLENSSGSFLAGLTKIELDYADYLVSILAW